MSACLKNWIKTSSPSATMCIHLSIPISCKSFSKIRCWTACSFPWTRTSIKSSPNRSKNNRKNSGQAEAEAKTGGIWQSFWLNKAFNEVGFEYWLTGDSAGMARAWPYYFARLPKVLIAGLLWKLFIVSACILVSAFSALIALLRDGF